MVALSAILLGYAALALASASPLEDDMVTPVEEIVALDHSHPAFGAALEGIEYEPVAPSASANETRKLEAVQVYSDLRRLESYFGVRMDRDVNKLVKKSEFTPAPWPGSYWPVYEDGINARWAFGEASPAEKYARAYGLDVKAFMDGISRSNGILSQSRRRECSSNADCQGLNDGSRCGKRDGESKGRCIPTWFGICHSWAPAAFMEPEPKCPVTINGVTFRVVDIKALMTQLYDGARVGSVFTGARYNGVDDTPKDSYGRFTDYARRDLNPGFFHIALTNIMGRFKRSFVVDVDSSLQVWNQPARSYSIVEEQMMTPAEAAQKYFKTNSYSFNSRARKIQYVRTRFSYVLEMNGDGPLVSTGIVDRGTRTDEYTYLLELDANDNIIGGEWLYGSMERHPDFLWFPVDHPSMSTVTNVNLSYKNLKELLNASINKEC